MDKSIICFFSSCEGILEPPGGGGLNEWQGIEDVTNWDIRVHNGDSDIFEEFAMDSDNNLYVLGSSEDLINFTLSIRQWWVKKYNINGREIKQGWDKRFEIEDSSSNYPACIYIDRNDYVYIGGSFGRVLEYIFNNFWF